MHFWPKEVELEYPQNKKTIGFCIRERVYKGNGGVFIKSKQALKMCLCMITMIDGTFHSQFKLNKKIGEMVILRSPFQ